MIFGIDDGIVEHDVDLDGVTVNKYHLINTKQVDEAEMFRVFRKTKNIIESKYRIECKTSINFEDYGLSSAPSMSKNAGYKIPKTAEYVLEHKHMFPFSGAYIIPKMFGYFPLLDCDDLNTYTEAKFQLIADGIPYISYKSSNAGDHYWIFCDRQCGLDEAIDFIETYPCDHRYPWIARYKRELCVRAIPKLNYIPHQDDDNLATEFSDDFTYWNAQFVKYWDNGLIPNYIELLSAVNDI